MTRKKANSPIRRILNRKPIFSQEVFERLWRQNLSVPEIAEFFGVATAVVDNAVATLTKKEEDRQKKIEAYKQKIAERKQQKFRVPRKCYNDTEPLEWAPGELTLEEIWARAAEIRSKWSEEETARRIAQRSMSVHMRTYIYDDRKGLQLANS